jgi:hypothetical protein
MRQLQRQKIASDYSRQSGEVLKTLPQEAVPKPREEPDEWELASRVQPVERPRRNLAAEEAAGSGGFQGRNLAAEEKEINTAPLNKTSESNDKVNAAVLAFAQTVAAKNDELTRKLTDLETKVKNARP